jgi:hypothetical protein
MFFYILVTLLSQTNQNIELYLEKNLGNSSFSALKYYLNIYKEIIQSNRLFGNFLSNSSLIF